jgi:hypothetical protein
MVALVWVNEYRPSAVVVNTVAAPLTGIGFGMTAASGVLSTSIVELLHAVIESTNPPKSANNIFLLFIVSIFISFMFKAYRRFHHGSG